MCFAAFAVRIINPMSSESTPAPYDYTAPDYSSTPSTNQTPTTKTSRTQRGQQRGGRAGKWDGGRAKGTEDGNREREGISTQASILAPLSSFGSASIDITLNRIFSTLCTGDHLSELDS